MRILYQHRTLADGAEGVHIAEMLRAFRELGHEVRLIGAEPGVVSRPSSAARIKQLLPAPAFELASIGYNVAAYVDVARAIAAFRPHFLYKRHARFDLAPLLAARRRGIPSFLEVNCLYGAGPYQDFEPMTLGAVARRLERRALQAASVVATVSSPLARQVRHVAGVEALVLPNGADPRRFDPARVDATPIKARYGLGGAIVVGWVGILREWHGLELLIDALPPLAHVRLLLVGDGPARERIEARARAAGVADRVIITGRIGHDAVPACIAAMDIAVVADERTGVASPMKLLEYMAMGKAVVAPDLPNIQDIVTPGVEGLLFSPGDGISLGRALGAIAGDNALRTALGARGRDAVLTARNWQAVARTVVAEIARVGTARDA